MDQIYDLYPLVQSQKRIWSTQMIYNDSHMFNIGGTVKIYGHIDIKLLRKAIELFIEEHDAFSIRLCMKDNMPYQYFCDESTNNIPFIDFSNSANKDNEFTKWVDTESKESIFGENIPLYSFRIFKIDDDNYGYFAKTHHIISDGWSMQILTREINMKYELLLKGESEASKSQYGYRYYILSQQEYFESPRFKKDKEFWLRKFETLPDEMSYGNTDIQGIRKTYYIDKNQKIQIEEYCKENHITKNIFFLSVYLIYMYKENGRDDIIIGSPFLGRKGAIEKETYGMFVSSIPFRYKIDSDSSVLNMFHKVNKELLNCFFHYEYPYNYLVNEVSSDSKSLYTECINYYNTKMSMNLGEYKTITTEFYNGEQEYDRQLIIKDWNDNEEIQIDVDYKIKSYTEEDIECMIDRLNKIIEGICRNIDLKIKEISMLSNDEKNMLLRFNSTDCSYPHESVVDVFRRQVVEKPYKVALEKDKQTMTYSELDMKSDCLAAYIQKRLGYSGNIIPVLVTHSFDSIISILAVLKSGNAYLPIDESIPRQRIEYILKDAKVNMLLTNLFNRYFNLNVAEIVDLNSFVYDDKKINDIYKQKINRDSKAYIIYTSGSTGNPKGVIISHRALFNYIEFAKRQYVRSMDDVFPLYTSLSFDLTVTSIFTPLVSGCKIEIYDNENIMLNLEHIFWNSKCTIVKLTPAHLALIANKKLDKSSVKTLIVGGDNLVVSLAKKIYENSCGYMRIYNEYGPTEATVGCMIKLYNPDYDIDDSVPIGSPISNMKVLLLDKDYNPVPKGITGELYISGIQLAEGYLNNKEQTDKYFIIVEKYKSLGVLYKTGDLGKFINNNVVKYVGRTNHQVKINGYRVELKEIESVLCQYPRIEQAVVTINNVSNQSKMLIAYYVSSKNITNECLQEFLAEKLPYYMIPNIFLYMESFPYNQNGKIDVSKLPAPILNKGAQLEYATNDKESILLTAVSKILDCDIVNINDNFIYLGGDSIKAIQLSGVLAEYGYKLKTKDILHHPLLKDLACFMEKGVCAVFDPETVSGEFQLTPVMKNYLKGEINYNNFCQSVLIELKDKYEISVLQKILDSLIEQHDSLRINYNKKDGTLFYVEDYIEKLPLISEYNLKNMTEMEAEEEIHRRYTVMTESMSIVYGIPVKASVFRKGQNRDILLVVIHHFCIDGISWRVMINEIDLLCEQYKKNQEFNLGARTSSFKSWCEAMQKSADALVDMEYWTRIMKELLLLRPTILFNPDNEQITVEGSIDTDITSELLGIINKKSHTKPEELFVTALSLAYFDSFKKDEVIYQFEGNGRYNEFENCNINKTTGWFTNMYPISVKRNNTDLKECVRYTKNIMRGIPNYGISFGYCPENERMAELEKNCIRFNYLGEFSSGYNNLKLDIEHSMSYMLSSHINCLMEINILYNEDQLRLYFRSCLEMKKIEYLKDRCLYWLRRIANDSINEDDYIVTPLDFEHIDISQEDLDTLFE